MKYLYKKDALFELYSLENNCDYFSIYITNKTNRGNYYGEWLEFQKELEELEITDVGGDEDWICEKEGITRELLKIELEKRGFEVKII